ncbi:MAG TPA: AMIN domain-containing protein, partial [Myxococcaceae bacterium]|nr:AMIN domain-containing protein [Myxococcaceae bacterium]
AAAEEKKRSAAETQAAAEEKKRSAAEERQAVLDERRRKAEEAQAAIDAKRREVEEARQAAADAKRRKAEEAQAAREGRKVAAADTGRTAAQEPATRAPVDEPVSVSARRKTVTFLGFRQEAGTSRVYVRTDEPVRYSVSKGKGSVVLELENTGFGAANTRRPIDTSFFPSSVVRVSPRGGDKSARFEIMLKQDVPYEAHQQGNEVFLEFPRPNR